MKTKTSRKLNVARNQVGGVRSVVKVGTERVKEVPKHRRRKPIAVLLRFLAQPPFPLTAVLRPLTRGIRDCAERIEAAAGGAADYEEAVTDEECLVVEELLGTAYVVCQAYITSVVSEVMVISAMAKSRGVAISISPKKDALMAVCDALDKGTKLTRVQIINAFANCFKHRFEWPADWSRARGQAAQTIRMLEKVGASAGSSGNMRTASAILGNPDFSSLNVLADILDDWRTCLHSSLQTELKKARLV